MSKNIVISGFMVASIVFAAMIGMVGGILFCFKVESNLDKSTTENVSVVEAPTINVVISGSIVIEEEKQPIQQEEFKRTYNIRYETSTDTKIKVWSWNGKASIKAEQLRQTIEAVQERMSIIPSNDENVVALVLETAATESHLGKYVRQINGPARGIFQAEPFTESCLLSWLKKNHTSVYREVMFFFDKKKSKEWNLEHNVPYQIALCTAHYWRYFGDKLPELCRDQLYRAMLWKARYNTVLGKGDIAKYLCDAEDFAV